MGQVISIIMFIASGFLAGVISVAILLDPGRDEEEE